MLKTQVAVVDGPSWYWPRRQPGIAELVAELLDARVTTLSCSKTESTASS
jgi:hypothetical protein